MRTNTWRIKGFVPTSVILVLSAATAVRGEEAKPPGVVDISDAAATSPDQPATSPVETLFPEIKQLASEYEEGTVDADIVETYPAIVDGPVSEMTGNPIVDWWRVRSLKRQAKRNNEEYVVGVEGPVYVGEGPAYRSTGIPFIDLYKSMSMRMRGQTMRHYHNLKARAKGRTTADKRWKSLRCKFGYFIPTGCCGGGCPIVGSYHMVYATNPGYFDPRDGRVYSAEGYGTPMAVPLAPNVENTYNYGWGIPSSRLTPISRRVPEKRAR